MLFGIHWDLSSQWAFAWSILPILGHGLLVTLQATACGFGLALLLGLGIAIAKLSPYRWIAWPTAFIAEFLRDTPLLVQLYFLYFVLPVYGFSLPAFAVGTLALGLQYAAYTAECYRAGIEAVGRGQREAAYSINLGAWRTLWNIILPQAIPRIIPALGNYLVSMLKDTPVLSAITVLELLNVAKIIGDRTFRYLIPLTMSGVIFLLLTIMMAWLVHCLERRLPKHGIPMR